MTVVLMAVSNIACRAPEGQPKAPRRPRRPQPGPQRLDVVRVVEQPLDVQLSLPGELTAVSVGGDIPAGHWIREDRQCGPRFQSAPGDVLVTRTRLNSWRSGRRPSRKCRARRRKLRPPRRKRTRTGVRSSGSRRHRRRRAWWRATTWCSQKRQPRRASISSRRPSSPSKRHDKPSPQSATWRAICMSPRRSQEWSANAMSIPVRWSVLRLRAAGHRFCLLSTTTACGSSFRCPRPIPPTFRSARKSPSPWRRTPGARSPVVSRESQRLSTRTHVTMAVEFDVANGDGQLASGTFCQVRWPVRRRGPSLFVPSSSVAATTDRTFVIRIRDGKTEWVDVSTGLTSGPFVEVFGDLRAGDQVANRGTDELRPGTAVRPREAKPAA